MPGLTVLASLHDPLATQAPAAMRATRQLLYDDRYECNTLLTRDDALVCCSRYPTYPVSCFQTPDYWMCLEGCLYGCPPEKVEAELQTVAHSVFSSAAGRRSSLTAWLRRTDGDFVIALLNKRSNELALLNDNFGRLHLYQSRRAGLLVISREIRLFSLLDSPPSFDKMGLGQFLLLGYPLAQRTLLNDVQRMLPATLITINFADARVDTEVLYTHNFEHKRHRSRSIQENARELSTLFVQACEARNDPARSNFISLSGGMHSRTIAAGYYRAGIPCVSATFVDHNKVFQLDLVVAEELARLFGLAWKPFELPPPRGRDCSDLLSMKQGLNGINYSFMHPFFEWIVQTYGPGVSYITGDVGGHMVPDRRPQRHLKDLDGLTNYILEKHSVMPISTVSTLTGLSTATLRDGLEECLAAYPEDDWNQKYVHFFCYERNYRWNAEGEDRNRYFFWHTTPFSSPAFLDCVTNCPDQQKADWALYQEFLLQLAPQALKPGLVNFHGATASSVKGRLLRLKRKLWTRAPLLSHPVQHVLDALRQRRARPWGETTVACISEQLADWRAAEAYLRESAVREVLRNSEEYGAHARGNLLTVVSLLEEQLCGRSTLQKYAEAEFS